MAVGREVRADATVGSVGSSASLNGSLDDDVVDDASVGVESLGLCVGFEVDEELLDGLASLFWPAAEWQSVDLSLGCSSNASRVLSEWNDCGVSNNSVHVLDGCVELHALAETSNFIAILVMRSQVRDSALGGYTRNQKIKESHTFCWLSWLSGVLDHCKSLPIY